MHKAVEPSLLNRLSYTLGGWGDLTVLQKLLAQIDFDPLILGFCSRHPGTIAAARDCQRADRHICSVDQQDADVDACPVLRERYRLFKWTGQCHHRIVG